MVGQTLRTQVCIIGGGPAGMFLSHVLAASGIDSIVVERQTKAHVLGRIRAGVLEHGTVALLREYGLAERMDREGMVKKGTRIVWHEKDDHFIDTVRWTGKPMMNWGQTQITEDLYAARERDGGVVICEAENVRLHDIAGAPSVTFDLAPGPHTVSCDFIVGCDGFHGPSRGYVPSDLQRNYERVYPFGWLGIMVERPPLPDITYAYHPDGFALASRRNERLSRYYIQVPVTDRVEDWSDDRFWDALMQKFPEPMAAKIETGPSVEKSIAPLRSFVSEPMAWGKLFLAGDAAHIVPPTGAKGLNLAFSDTFYLSRALIAHYGEGDDHYLDTYSDTALRRVWAVESLSWRLTRLLHAFPNEDPFDQQLRQAEYDLLLRSEDVQRALAYEYVGLPFEA
ncbi:4-hydroxybenzoate 3-monooxygenase [Ovoidimarina sediminis]|uniref:4-hydroxybenzoate 3-monooxygenase n=1 Tax=Ovoidimarina sediminis TaxID=3079856 RepID=UPI00290853D5|nr:4-hydroxybenzoate 3-monooxygenase [Rhodophyticola sp. MJ-SS7]MDU8944685.1 4-hydroxybenzoate 3-monooxygenase [Rhodophyticola sp. MJ-SS7]